MNKINLHIFGSKIFFDILNELDFGYDIIFHNNRKYYLNKKPLNSGVCSVFSTIR